MATWCCADDVKMLLLQLCMILIRNMMFVIRYEEQ